MIHEQGLLNFLYILILILAALFMILGTVLHVLRKKLARSFLPTVSPIMSFKTTRKKLAKKRKRI